MNKQKFVVLVALMCALRTSGIAAPPAISSYVDYTLVIDPDAAERVQINLPAAAEYSEDASVKHNTRSPSIFVFEDYVIAPGGNTGWHIHQGKVLVTVADGSVEWYDANCGKHVHATGEFFMEGDQIHYVRNVNANSARLILTFILAKGATKKTYRPAPPCAAAGGLDEARFPALK
jgi:quercetin dioxygenase-like cupin family protein